MKKLGDYVKTADWKTEKHTPAIDCPETVKPGEPFEVTAEIGREIPHPNTTEHHIVWIALHFIPEGAKASFEIGRFEFSAHGQSAAGPNQGPVYTESRVRATIKIDTAGEIHATSYCNIHGLWESSRTVALA